VRRGISRIELAVSSGDHKGSASRHRIPRVGGKIGDHRLELGPVDLHRPDRGRQRQLDGDVLAQRSGQQLHDPADDFVDVGSLGLQRLAPRECEETPRQVRPAQRRFERIAHQFLGHQVVLTYLPQQVEVADDDCQQVVEVVRKAAGKLADRLHLLGLAQLVALLVRLAPLGQVANDPDEGLVAAVRQFADRQVHREGRAILAAPNDLAATADDPRHAGL
jgi:hypothetical protein